MMAPYYNWTGLYVGINGGGGWGTANWNSTGDFDVSGGVVGGTVGYNWQFGTWVVRMAEKVPAPMKHYDTVIRDMLGTLDQHLASNEYVAGAYSIADMTMYPDVHLHGVKDIGLGDYPNLERWHDAIEARPAIQRAWGPFPA